MQHYKTDHSGRCLGKHPKRSDRRTLKMSRYLPTLPAPPAAVDHASKLPKDIGMMGNDKLGDCAICAAAHQMQSWTAYTGTMITIPEQAVIATYKVLSPNDQGCALLDVLNYWQKTGISADHIEAFIEIAAADLTQHKLAIQYFGSAYIGLSLPDQNTFGPWTVAAPPWPRNVNNGHAVCLLGYDDARQMFKVATWGEILDLSYGWLRKYNDESYACLNDIMLMKSSGKSPEGFDWASLEGDLAHLGDPMPLPGPPATPGPLPSTFGPLVITVQGDAMWTVLVDGVAQSQQHAQQFEALQHADRLRWDNAESAIEIRHDARYTVK